MEKNELELPFEQRLFNKISYMRRNNIERATVIKPELVSPKDLSEQAFTELYAVGDHCYRIEDGGFITDDLGVPVATNAVIVREPNRSRTVHKEPRDTQTKSNPRKTLDERVVALVDRMKKYDMSSLPLVDRLSPTEQADPAAFTAQVNMILLTQGEWDFVADHASDANGFVGNEKSTKNHTNLKKYKRGV